MLDFSVPGSRVTVVVNPLSSMTKPCSSGLKYLPITESVDLSTLTSALKISGARGVAVGVPVWVGVGVGVMVADPVGVGVVVMVHPSPLQFSHGSKVAQDGQLEVEQSAQDSR